MFVLSIVFFGAYLNALGSCYLDSPGVLSYVPADQFCTWDDRQRYWWVDRWIDGHIMIYHGYIRLYHILHSVFAKCICIHIYMYLEGCC